VKEDTVIQRLGSNERTRRIIQPKLLVLNVEEPVFDAYEKGSIISMNRIKKSSRTPTRLQWTPGTPWEVTRTIREIS
jgi:hypothetical protein